MPQNSLIVFVNFFLVHPSTGPNHAANAKQTAGLESAVNTFGKGPQNIHENVTMDESKMKQHKCLFAEHCYLKKLLWNAIKVGEMANYHGESLSLPWNLLI